jgi:hypothetical protein
MSDSTAERNNRLKATMRDQSSANLNTSGKSGVVVCSPNQSDGLKRRPMSHVDPGTGQKS